VAPSPRPFLPTSQPFPPLPWQSPTGLAHQTTMGALIAHGDWAQGGATVQVKPPTHFQDNQQLPRTALCTNHTRHHIDVAEKSSRLISGVMKPPCHECTFPRRRQVAAAPLLRCYASSERQGLRRKKWIPETFRSSANRHFYDTDRHSPCPASTPADAPSGRPSSQAVQVQVSGATAARNDALSPDGKYRVNESR
jgi:hypothetical protein